MKQLPIGIPIVGSLAAFILVLLALFAGSRPGFMEDYDLMAFNTSGLGKNLIEIGNDRNEPTPTSGGSLCEGIGGFLGGACSTATAVIDSLQSEVADKVNDIGNAIADELAERIGISEFYTLHALAICEGDFTPNATAPEADRNVTECHKGFTDGYNVSALLDYGLRVGPFELTLADLGFTDEIQDAVDTLSSVLKAFTALMIVGIGFTGLSMLASIATLFLIPRHERKTVLVNLILACFALIFLVLSGLIGTIATSIATDKINEKGADIGLSSSMGTGYLVITWVAVGLMLVAFGYWLWQFMRHRNGKTMDARGPRKHARDSEESGVAHEMRSVSFSRSQRH